MDSSDSGRRQKNTQWTQEQREKRYAMYNAYCDELERRELSNSEHYDRAVLALSSSALGLSLAFIEDIVSLPTAGHLTKLFWSWRLFLMAIVLTLFSFVISSFTLRALRHRGEQWYLQGDPSGRKKPILVWVNSITAWSAGLCFVVGTVLISSFIIRNMEDSRMKNSITEGAPDLAVRKLDEPSEKKGAPGVEPRPIPPDAGSQDSEAKPQPTSSPEPVDK